MENIISYIGCDDQDLDLFESQYVLEQGMCYNSYIVKGEQTAIIDSVDSRKTKEWLDKVKDTLQGRQPDYLIIQHMEPDHSGSVNALLSIYPDTTVVCSKKAESMLSQFNILPKQVQSKAEGDELNIGGVTLQFHHAPMVHWPEVMMTYIPETKTLFSADAFGKFGVYDADKDDWACEARRYYFNICGKYGVPVSNILKKVSSKEISTICPLHGPILEGEQLAEAMRLYTIWSEYKPETSGVLIAHASIHGNTAKAAELMGEMLRKEGVKKVVISDLCRDDMAEVIEDAFRMDRMLLCAASYDNNVFSPMHTFLWKLQQKGYQNRKVGILENGSWAPSAAREIKKMLEPMKDISITEPIITIKSMVKPENMAGMQALAKALS